MRYRTLKPGVSTKSYIWGYQCFFSWKEQSNPYLNAKIVSPYVQHIIGIDPSRINVDEYNRRVCELLGPILFIPFLTYLIGILPRVLPPKSLWVRWWLQHATPRPNTSSIWTLHLWCCYDWCRFPKPSCFSYPAKNWQSYIKDWFLPMPFSNYCSSKYREEVEGGRDIVDHRLCTNSQLPS